MTLDAWATAEAIRDGSARAVDVVQAALDRIAASDGPINAFTDRHRRSLRWRPPPRSMPVCARGPLAGVPISVKDHVWVRGLPATNGSRALASFVPDEDCVCVARLVEAGAVIVGKTNNPEFCYRGITDNDALRDDPQPAQPRPDQRRFERRRGGVGRRPGWCRWRSGRTVAGRSASRPRSAGRSGSSRRSGSCRRCPGFRGWPTLSVTGPIAASVRDLALALSVMAGPSAADPLSYPAPPADYLAAVVGASLAGLRVAVSADLGIAEVDPDVRAAFADRGGRAGCHR